jgi:subtilase family serine protease
MLKKLSLILSVVSVGVLLFLIASHNALPVQANQPPSFHFSQVCPAVPIGFAQCQALRKDRGRTGATPQATSAPTGGYSPSQLQNAYSLPSATAGSGQTVAIIDAYDDPNAESDLSVYRALYGLPACTTANGCFKKVDQNDSTSYPTANSAWAQEISLDLDMVSAICPNCHILLVEASSASFQSLGTAVNTAVNLGANVISNSYAGSEFSGETAYASYYDHPGTVITASAGDYGYGVRVPAAFNTVVAVGGTTLSPANNDRGWDETAWSSGGGGCSAYISKPSWQTDSGCSMRTVADVAAVADPTTGVSIYDTLGGAGGWLVMGGTSAASPIIAAVYALAGNASSINAASSLYSNADQLYDIASGSNGSCNGSYLCTAGVGYDGPTGVGTPNSTGAF